MKSGSHVIASKIVNAFIRGAKPSLMVGIVPAGILKFFGQFPGGIWINGKVTLTPETVSFSPNSINRKLYADAGDISIPLTTVVEVKDRAGVLTHIVDVRAEDGTVLSFRGFGAHTLGQKIDMAAKTARSGASAG